MSWTFWTYRASESGISSSVHDEHVKFVAGCVYVVSSLQDGRGRGTSLPHSHFLECGLMNEALE